MISLSHQGTAFSQHTSRTHRVGRAVRIPNAKSLGLLNGRPRLLVGSSEVKAAAGGPRPLSGQIGAHLVNHCLVVRLAKNRAAGHEGVGAGIGHGADIAFLDAAIDF